MGVTAAAIVTAAAAVGSAGYGMYQQSKAADAAKAGAGGSPSALYGSKIKLPNFPHYHAESGAQDYLSTLPYLNSIATSETGMNSRLREKVAPGARQLLTGGMNDLIQMSQGVVPSDVQNQTARGVAERFGGSFDPSMPTSFAGGGSQAKTDFARNLGQTSQDQITKALSVAPTWETLADSFVYKPSDALSGAMNFLTQRFNWDEAEYQAKVNKAQGFAMPDPQAVGARNDAMTMSALSRLGGTKSDATAAAIAQIPTTIQALQSGYSHVNSAVSGNPMSNGYYSTSGGAIADTGMTGAAQGAGGGWYGTNAFSGSGSF